MTKEKDCQDDVDQRRVIEVRRTTLVPKVSKERFVFEQHEDEWHIHFAAATHYSVTQLKEILQAMSTLPQQETTINIEEENE